MNPWLFSAESLHPVIVVGADVCARVTACCRRATPRRLISLIAALLALAPTSSQADEPPKLPAVVQLGTHSLTLPWHLGPVSDRLNPAFLLGTEHTFSPGDPFRFYLTANAGVFQSYWWMTAVFIDSEVGLGCRLPLGFHSDVRLGLGYMHSFWRRKSLERKDGEYVESRHWGSPSLMVPLSLLIGYSGTREEPWNVAPFVSMQWAAQGLFLEEIPALPHLFLLLGARIDWERMTSAGGR